MKSIVFRPLRRIKKTGKITVASYMGWNKVRCANYDKFNLIIDDEYNQLPKDEFVYNHNGELLYFFDYSPADVPIFQYSKMFDLDEIRANNGITKVL